MYVKNMTKICFRVLLIISLTVIGISTSVAAGRKRPHVTRNNDVLILEYDFAEPDILTEGDFDIVTIDGLERYGKAGEPVLPVKPVEILVPAGMKITKITSIPIDTYQLPDTYKLSHGYKPRRKPPYGEKAEPAPLTQPDPEIFGMTEFWPGENHDLVTVQINRGYNIAHVNLFPLQYSPKTGKIKMATKMRLTVHLAPTDSHRRAKPTRHLKNKLERKIDNPETMRSYDTYSAEDPLIPAKSAVASTPLNDPAGTYYGANYEYIVLTSAFLADANNIPDPSYSFQALCDSKTARGITAGIVTTEWIYANYTGTDNAAKIRNFLIDAYETWETEYALLGGNKDIIPVRTWNTDGENIPADMYYGCVDPPGASDGDDLTAEISVGRASVENSTDVANFVNKTLVYGSTFDPYLDYALSGGGWLGFAGIAEFNKPFSELIRLGSDLYTGHYTCGFAEPASPNTRNFDNIRDFNVATLYDADGTWDATTDLVPILNGTGGNTTPQLVYIADHGSTIWGMVKMKTTETSEPDCDTLLNLNNTRPFFFYDDSCDVGHFDSANCFSEVATTMEYGAFACITNSRSGWGGTAQNPLDSPTTQLTREFYHSFLGEGTFELGRAHADAKERCIWRISFTRYDIYQSTLFGDPELRLRVTDEYTCGDLDGSGGNADLVDYGLFANCWGENPLTNSSCASANLVEFDKHTIDLLDLCVLTELFLSSSSDYPPNCSTSITDPYPPSPATMSFATAPYATGDSSIAMIATTATDISGVEYYFTCTAGGGDDSGWQDSTSYEDTGLTPATGYTYTVKARDLSVNYNETAASGPASATTNSTDTTVPDPCTMSFATPPYATGDSSIAMVATTATDVSGVEYYFTCTVGAGNNSNWQPGTIYEDTGLSPATEYTYTVIARDKSVAQNQTAASGPASATTDFENILLPANGGNLDSFTSEYGGGWVASDLTNRVTNEDGWCNGSGPEPQQEFVYSFSGGNSATLDEAIIHGGTAEGRYYSKDVEVWTSANGTSYTLRGGGTLADSDGSTVTVDLTGIIAKKIKLVITSGYRSDYWELAEFIVSGEVIN